MISDLSGYLSYLHKKNMLARIREKVKSELEITAFTDIANRERKYDSKAILFENVHGYDVKVATNLFGSINVLNSLFDSEQVSQILGMIKGPQKGTSMLKSAAVALNAEKCQILQGDWQYIVFHTRHKTR